MATKKQIGILRDILEERHKTIKQNVDNIKLNIDSLKIQECKDDYDYADIASDSFSEGLIANKQLQELKEVEEALKAIDEKNYGICQMCDENIDLNRLKAKPFAKYCIACREIYESEQNE